MTLETPVTEVNEIMTTENIQSQARVGLLSPVSMVLATKESSIVITAAVRIRIGQTNPFSHTLNMDNNTRRKE